MKLSENEYRLSKSVNSKIFESLTSFNRTDVAKVYILPEHNNLTNFELSSPDFYY